jgi:hypothetical protein
VFALFVVLIKTNESISTSYGYGQEGNRRREALSVVDWKLLLALMLELTTQLERLEPFRLTKGFGMEFMQCNALLCWFLSANIPVLLGFEAKLPF